ncbi:3942_t:CDS:2 [Entrophospora sp. SA101]|nr:3942_t:CDS:2 [Entrophospora sp. SA101]
MSFRIEYLLSKALTPKSRNLKRILDENMQGSCDDDNGGNGTKHGYNNSSDNEGNENIKNGPDTRESVLDYH